MADGSFSQIILAPELPSPYYEGANGLLFEGDCLGILPCLPGALEHPDRGALSNAECRFGIPSRSR